MVVPVVARAEADRLAGRLWKARDRLQGAVLTHAADQDVLSLLGHVLFEMGDLPEAGRHWYLTDREGPDVDEALAAFHERHGHGLLLIYILPVTAPFTAYPPAVQARLHALASTLRRDIVWTPPSRPTSASTPHPMLALGLTAVVVAIVVCLVVGFFTILGWLVW